MSGRVYTATFTPQAWVRDYAITVDAEGPVEWDCTAGLAELDAGYRARLIASGHDVDDQLKEDPGAPAWVREWSGPFEIHVRDVTDEPVDPDVYRAEAAPASPIRLSESFQGTIMAALAHEMTPAAIETLRELERQGWRLPPWVLDRLENETEREALRREAHDEAMLDAGPILAEHRRLKGE